MQPRPDIRKESWPMHLRGSKALLGCFEWMRRDIEEVEQSVNINDAIFY